MHFQVSAVCRGETAAGMHILKLILTTFPPQMSLGYPERFPAWWQSLNLTALHTVYFLSINGLLCITIFQSSLQTKEMNL